MKSSRKLFASLFAGWLFSLACLAAGPTRDEVKSWTLQYQLGQGALKQYELQPALQLFMAALDIAEKFGPKDVRLADNLRICGRILLDAGQLATAEPHLRKAAAVREAALGSAHRETAFAWLDHAEALTELDRPVEAEELIQRARKSLEKAFGPYHPAVGICLAAQARVKARQKRFTEAEALYQQALGFLGRTSTIVRSGIGGFSFLPGTLDNFMLVRTQINLADLYALAGRHADAVTAYQKALEMVEAKQGKEGAALPYPLTGLAQAQIKQQNYAAAEAAVGRAAKVAEKAYGLDHPASFAARATQVDLFVAQKKWKEAKAEGVRIIAGMTPTMPSMARGWIPLFEAMVRISEQLEDQEGTREYRLELAKLLEFHAKESKLPAP